MKPAVLCVALLAACSAGPVDDADPSDAGTPVADAGVPDAGPVVVPDPPDPDCIHDGCLREAKQLGTFSKAALERAIAGGVTIDNGYTVWTIRYATHGLESLATVTIPDTEAPAAGFHVVANNHGTSGLDDPCKLANTTAGSGLAGLFGARGAVGVASDYPGLGTDGVHPYLVSEVEGTAALDSLRAATHLARWQEVPLSGRTAMVGLSQGGHVTLAAAALQHAYAPELDVRAYGVTAPASAWEAQWSRSLATNGPHVAYLAMTAYAWASYYGWDAGSLWAPTFAEKVDGIMTGRCVFALAGPTILSSVPQDPAKVFDPALLDAWRTRVWGNYGFVHDAFEANAIGPFAQQAPLRIYQGDADTTVPEAATRELVTALEAGGVEVDYQVVPGGAHTNVAFGFVSAAEKRTAESIAWVQGELDR